MPASFSQTIIMGNLGQDPVVRYSQNQTAIAELSVATSEHYTNKQTQQKEEKVEWHRVKCFGRNAEIARDWLKKGSAVQIVGKNKTRKFKDSNTGQDRFITEVEANKFDGLLLLGSNSNSSQGQQPRQQAPHGFSGQTHQNHKSQPNSTPAHDNSGYGDAPMGHGHPDGGFDERGGFGHQ